MALSISLCADWYSTNHQHRPFHPVGSLMETKLIALPHDKVKWTGWPKEYDEWIPNEDMDGAQDLIQEHKTDAQRKRKRNARLKEVSKKKEKKELILEFPIFTKKAAQNYSSSLSNPFRNRLTIIIHLLNSHLLLICLDNWCSNSARSTKRRNSVLGLGIKKPNFSFQPCRLLRRFHSTLA